MTAIPASTDAPGADPAAAAPEGATGETAPEVDPFAPVDGGEPAAFPREYVQKLRTEGAKYRTQLRERETELESLKPLAGVFEGWEPEQVEGWKTFLGQAQQDPEGAITALVRDGFGLDREGATALLDAMFEADAAAPTTVAGGADNDDPNRPLTRAEYDALQAEAAQQRELTQAVSTVQGEAKELGYKPDAPKGSPEEFQYQRLLHLAANTTDGDLSKAHDALVAEEQEIVKRHLAKMAETADGLPIPTGTTSPGVPTDGQESKSLKTAGPRALEFLRAQPKS